MNNKQRSSGFTLLELMFAIAIVAILAATVVIGYRHYMARASSTELVELYDALRQQVVADASGTGTDLCDDPPMSIVSKPWPKSRYVDLNIVKMDHDKGKPLGLLINADIGRHGEHNTDIARQTYNILNKGHHVAPKHTVNDSVVTFVALLVNTPCSATLQAAQKPQPPAVQQPPVVQPPPANCASGDEAVTVPDGFGGMVSICLKKCPAGQTRDPNNFMQCIDLLPPQKTTQQAVQACNITPPVPCRDMYTGNCKADFAIGSDPSINVCDNCAVATVCPQTCGVCQ
jgi:prepilin-type N-terminal cleavage/methylation domain-containing protein